MASFRLVRRIQGAALVFTTLICARAVAADDAEALIKHGIQLRKEGKDREALSEFQRALAIRETPRALAQVGLAEEALGLWLPSEQHLSAAVKQGDDPWIKKNRAVLNEALAGAAGHIGTVEIWGEPAGAEIIINGNPAGKLPNVAPVRVLAGACSLVAHADGYDELSRTLRVNAGDLVRENVQLVPSPAPRRRALSDSALRPQAKDGAPPMVNAGAGTAAPAPEEASGLTGKWWFWTALGVVVAGGIVGAILLTRPQGRIGCPQGVECP